MTPMTLGRATDLRVWSIWKTSAPHYATNPAGVAGPVRGPIRMQVRAPGLPGEPVSCGMWDYYLCYCEGGFRERAIGTVQVLLTKPLCRREPLTPALG
jgi:cyclopropane-fatty-acyl-phospholipid synthase